VIGRAKFCAVVCDSTGNTRASRRLTVAEVPTALNVADIVHHISNTVKDIVKLEFFSETIKITRGVITKFHSNSSHMGSAELKAARKELHTGPGLEAIGKTRFGTIILSARSVQRTVPALKRVVQNNKFNLEVCLS
jgi:hypothetical protein